MIRCGTICPVMVCIPGTTEWIGGVIDVWVSANSASIDCGSRGVLIANKRNFRKAVEK